MLEQVIVLSTAMQSASQNTSFKKASLILRLGNYLIDMVTFILVGSLFGACIRAGLSAIGSVDLINSPNFQKDFKFLGYGLFFLYYYGFEVLLEATPGKFITRTRVKTTEGFRATPSKIAVRALVRLIPFEPFTFLVGQGLHDKLSGTIVVEHP